ncbi:MAG TPA: POTRA domain-containing protein [Vicinamibacterales bacterium]|jgi:hypothetical protein
MMRRGSLLIAALVVWLLPAAAYAQIPPQEPGQVQPATPLPPTLRDVRITGAHELQAEAVIRAGRLRVGDPLPVATDHLEDLERRVRSAYADEGYTFARVHAAFDDASGTLSLDIDEGIIGGVEFVGVDDQLKRQFSEEFALRAGDVFNRRRARQALEVLLRPTRGAVRPSRSSDEEDDAPGGRHTEGPFSIVDRNGDRVLVVTLSEPAGRFRLVPDPGDREDWFSSVDGFVPSMGFGAAVFDHTSFNHSYVAGHISYKFAPDRVGYALGFERPFFGDKKLYVGGELHDLTASDDQWQVSSLEASLAAFGPRESFRDYYRRRGVQIGTAFRPNPHVELLAIWRSQREEPLPVATDFSLWNSDDAFRPNVVAQDGRLNALIVGASVDSGSFNLESLDATYRRHQLDTFYGERLNYAADRHAATMVWRVDWSTEISPPDAFSSDFDFRRSVVSARMRTPLSEHQDFGVRALGGWTEGIVPPQRLFSIGGIGSVHGYEFKEATGTSLALVNLEYALGWRNAFQVLGFFDAGRVAPDSGWLKGVGFGVSAWDIRLDFGYRTDAIPSSLQVLLRFGRTF